MSNITILDGGMGRQLHVIGAPFRQPEWSALALLEAPHYVCQAHMDFIKAGADIITVNSYAIVPFHIGEERFATKGAALLQLAVEMAMKARTEAKSKRQIKIAGSVPPVCGSYAPQYFDKKTALPILELFRDNLQACDLILAETLSSIEEVITVQNVFADISVPLWISMTLDDSKHIEGRPCLRSEETVADALAAIFTHKPMPQAILFNCSQPEIMEEAIHTAHEICAHDTKTKDIKIGVYANAFEPKDKETSKANEDYSVLRPDLTPQLYAQFAKTWIAKGATIIGGCCGIGPDYIRQIKDIASA
ncbi:MAG: homocysteine S-methyltransferase family protein [Alphaproteobacteria bacterium]|nr:homocysteine S-methyltransferase family protein [Alphaproteobacteria bacterium]